MKASNKNIMIIKNEDRLDSSKNKLDFIKIRKDEQNSISSTSKKTSILKKTQNLESKNKEQQSKFSKVLNFNLVDVVGNIQQKVLENADRNKSLVQDFLKKYYHG